MDGYVKGVGMRSWAGSCPEAVIRTPGTTDADIVSKNAYASLGLYATQLTSNETPSLREKKLHVLTWTPPSQGGRPAR